MCGFYLRIGEIDFDEKALINKIAGRGTSPVRMANGFVNKAPFSVAHARLNINGATDLQPVITDGYVFIYNGSIYNWDELNGQTCDKFMSDTQLLAHICDCFRCRRFYDTIVGSFAACRLDLKENVVEIFRDGFFQKPLHSLVNKSSLIVSSWIVAPEMGEHFTPDQRIDFRNIGHGIPNTDFSNYHDRISVDLKNFA